MAKLYRAVIRLKIPVVVVGEMVKVGAAAKVVEAAEASDSQSIQEIQLRQRQLLQLHPEMKMQDGAAAAMAEMSLVGAPEEMAMVVVRQ